MQRANNRERPLRLSSRIALAGLVSFASLGACNKAPKGQFDVDFGRPLTMRSAFLVSHGGESFRLYASNKPQRCGWAERGATGFPGEGEVTFSMDGGPLFGEDGTFTSQAQKLNFSSYEGAVFSPSGSDWKAPFTFTPTTGCGRHITFHTTPEGKDAKGPRPGKVDLDADIACCEVRAPKDGAMRAHVGGKTMSFVRVGEKKRATGSTYVITRVHEPCSGDMTFEDARIDADVDAKGKVTSLRLSGRLFPGLGIGLASRSAPPTLTRVGAPGSGTLKLDGKASMKIEFYRTTDNEFPVEFEGELPVSKCPD